jgi:hypothetical protein
MIIKVEPYSRGSRNGYRLSIPIRGRSGPNSYEYVVGEKWGLRERKDALMLLRELYHISSKNVRFSHR